MATKSKGPTPFEIESEDRQAAKWLDAEMAKAAGSISSQKIALTPALARVLLQRNTHNRTLSSTYIENYARDIIGGAWKFNGEAIIVSSDGSLNDGQHRCEAVALANKSIETMLVIGVARDTRTTLDQGRTRTTGDYLAMEGKTDTNVLAAAGRMAWQWQKLGFVTNNHAQRPTKGEVISLIRATPALGAAVSAVPTKNSNLGGGRSVLVFCRFAFSVAAQKGDVDAFIYGLMNGENLSSGSAILAARNRIASGQRLLVGEKVELLFRAWNFYRRGAEVRAINLQGGELPLLES